MKKKDNNEEVLEFYGKENKLLKVTYYIIILIMTLIVGFVLFQGYLYITKNKTEVKKDVNNGPKGTIVKDTNPELKDNNKYNNEFKTLYIYLDINNKIIASKEMTDEYSYLRSYNCSSISCGLAKNEYINNVTGIILLSDNEQEFIYDYKNYKILSNNFKEIKNTIINDKTYLVTDDYNIYNTYGIKVNKENLDYIDVSNHLKTYITVKSNEKYGLIDLMDGKYKIKPNYDEMFISNGVIVVKNKEISSIINEENKIILNNVKNDIIYADNNLLILNNDNKLEFIDYSLKPFIDRKIEFTGKYIYGSDDVNSIKNNEDVLKIKVKSLNDTYFNYQLNKTSKELKVIN